MTANEVDAALAAPRVDVGRQLLGLVEDQWFDRKSVRTSARDLGIPLTAFANAEGGTIVVGLHNGKVEGVRKHASRLNEFRQAPIDFTSPPVRATFESIKCVDDSGADEELLVIRVDPGEHCMSSRTATATSASVMNLGS